MNDMDRPYSQESSDHPDFESLSAHCDGQAPEITLHVTGCARCSAALAQIRSASRALASPPTIDAAVRSRAVAAALASQTVPAPSAAPTATPSPAEAGGADRRANGEFRSVTGPGGDRTDDRSSVWLRVLSVAAAVIALAGGATLFRSANSQFDPSRSPKDARSPEAALTAEAPPNERASDASATAQAGPQTASPVQVGDLYFGDLGTLDLSPDALKALTGGWRLAPAPPALRRIDEEISGGGASGEAGEEPRPACEVQAQARPGGDGVLFGFAIGSAGGDAVTVLAFSSPDNVGLDRKDPARGPVPTGGTVMVMSLEDCSLVTSVSLP